MVLKVCHGCSTRTLLCHSLVFLATQPTICGLCPCARLVCGQQQIAICLSPLEAPDCCWANTVSPSPGFHLWLLFSQWRRTPVPFCFQWKRGSPLPPCILRFLSCILLAALPRGILSPMGTAVLALPRTIRWALLWSISCN